VAQIGVNKLTSHEINYKLRIIKTAKDLFQQSFLSIYFWFWGFFFVAGSQYTAQVGLELMILLLDYGHVPPHQASPIL
jgi:hypothetical protein